MKLDTLLSLGIEIEAVWDPLRSDPQFAAASAHRHPTVACLISVAYI